MLLSIPHRLIFEFALIVRNRSALGYTAPWDYCITRDNPDGVHINFKMKSTVL